MTAETLHEQIDQLADAWLSQKRLESSTERAYRVEVRRLVEWARVRDEVTLDVLDPSGIVAYFDQIASDDMAQLEKVGITHPLLPSSLLQSKRIVASLLLWAAERGSMPLATVLAAQRWKPTAAAARKRPGHPPEPAVRRRGAPLSERELRDEFIAGLAYWSGARPSDIASLRRAHLTRRGRLLQVTLPNGKGESEKVLLPVSMSALWDDLKRVCCKSELAIVQVGASESLSIAHIGRILSRAHERFGGARTARGLRAAGVLRLRQRGWREVEVRQQYRRKTLPLKETPLPVSKVKSKLQALT